LLSDRLLQTNFWHCFLPASAFAQQLSSLCSTLPAQHVQPSGFFCCWSDNLELIARRQSGVFCGQLQTVTEDIFYFRSTSVFSALEVCYKNALYKFTFDIDIVIMCLCLGNGCTCCHMKCSIHTMASFSIHVMIFTLCRLIPTRASTRYVTYMYFLHCWICIWDSFLCRKSSAYVVSCSHTECAV